MVSRSIYDGGSAVTINFPAVPKHLAEVRREIEQAAIRADLSRVDVEDFLTAVDEAVANAIRHGSPRYQEDLISVVCQRRPGLLEVKVRDRGSGFCLKNNPAMPGPDAVGGRGLPLMCALADALLVESTNCGTCVTLHKRIDS